MNNILSTNRNNLEYYYDKLKICIDKDMDKKKNNYLSYLNKLEVLNPLLTIKRGYSISKINGKVVSSIKNIKKNDTLSVELVDGIVTANVEKLDKK